MSDLSKANNSENKAILKQVSYTSSCFASFLIECVRLRICIDICHMVGGSASIEVKGEKEKKR